MPPFRQRSFQLKGIISRIVWMCLKKVADLVYINSSIPSRQLHCRNLNLSIQAVPFEINLRTDKWLVISVYRPPSQKREYFSLSYDNHVIIGDFNLEPSTGLLKHFMNSNALYNLIKVNTCFKGR